MTKDQQIDEIIKLYGGWKAEVLRQIRAAVWAADPEVEESIKWRMANRPEGLPVWSHDSIVCFAETFKNDIKLVFFKGAKMPNHQSLFNARLQSSRERAIQYQEGDKVDASIIKQLVVESLRIIAEPSK